MAFPKYFQQFPNTKYAVSTNKAGQPTYINIKDYFHLLRVRDDIFKEETLYTEYYIQNGERPENISFKLYGDEQYYWILLQINDIVNYYDQWPLSSAELEEYILKKYGNWNVASQIHHWETVEVLDGNGNLVLPGGVVVSEDYEFTYQTLPGCNSNTITNCRVGEDPLNQMTVRPAPVTNDDYERRLNDKKSSIVILKEQYVPDYIRECNIFARNLPSQDSEIDIASNFR